MKRMVSRGNDGRAVFGVQFGNMIRPKEYLAAEHALPMEVPRVRYEVVTRRVRTGNDPPVADAGPNQIDVAAGTINWMDRLPTIRTAIRSPSSGPRKLGPPVDPRRSPTTSRPTFTAAAGTNLQLPPGGQGRPRRPGAGPRADFHQRGEPGTDRVLHATPTQITAGQAVTLTWKTLNADTVNIAGIGNVAGERLDHGLAHADDDLYPDGA